jgi:universal stress protein E
MLEKTMFKCSRILVVFDPYHDSQPAFERAHFLAKKMNANLLLVSCIYDETYDMTNFLTADQRVDMKNALLSAQQEAMHKHAQAFEGVNIEIKTVWHKSLYRGIIDLASHEHCDLVVKSVKEHTKFAQKIFTPNDWNLLRYSPMNVLMVKQHDWPENGNIVAAISIDANDKTHNLLSERVTQISLDIAQLVGGEVHLVNTFAGAPIHVAVEVPSFNAQAYNQDIEEKHKSEVAAIGLSYGISDKCQHVQEGLPEDVVPLICNNVDAELLVLGSVGRRGISAALLGNTAEHIIDKVNCDTLVVKPQVQ